MVGGGNRRDEGSMPIQNTNLFAALDTRRKKKKSDKAKASPVIKETEAQAKAWADIDSDGEDDDYFATTAPPPPPQPLWSASNAKEVHVELHGYKGCIEKERKALLDLKAYLASQGTQPGLSSYDYTLTTWTNDTTSDCCTWQDVKCNLTSGRINGLTISETMYLPETMFLLNLSVLHPLEELRSLNLSGGQTEFGGLFDNRSLTGLEILPPITLPNKPRNTEWKKDEKQDACQWPGVTCTPQGSRVTGISLSDSTISGSLFKNFSALTQLTYLDLSRNTMEGSIPDDLSRCGNLKHLNLSHNFLDGELNISGLSNLEVLDLSVNRITGDIHSSFPLVCNSLVVANLSTNNFTGRIDDMFNGCRHLKYVDFSSNRFSGNIWADFGSLVQFSVSENNLSASISASMFRKNCTLQVNLAFLDLSRNDFGGDIQEIFGRFTQVKDLVLHGNYYFGGISSSNILKLPNIFRLDLSYNNFLGPLPPEISQMQSLKFLILLAYNNFNGEIPHEYGNILSLQALDISFNRLNGSIPASFGKLTSLLWLMLANNSLSGEIPRETGSCSSLLWFNVANNQLSGGFYPELAKMGNNPLPTFEENRRNGDPEVAGSGECLEMKRWFPAEFSPFMFLFATFTKQSCRSLWDHVLKGYGFFPVCSTGSTLRALDIPAYLQLSGNKLSGEVPTDISQMKKLSKLHLGFNEFEGKLPPEIAQLPLTFLNFTRNKFSGEIPQEIGNLKCLQVLDLSFLWKFSAQIE
ncbi:hypothetical protein Bca4012_038738 [Brassica carinata]